MTFSSKKQDNLKYDALLLFKNQNICLELTRSIDAIDGKQENNMKQLLRQDGMAFSTDTGEVTYNKEAKTFNQKILLAPGDLYKTLFPSKLYHALEHKQQKNYQGAKYWLAITIDMGGWSQYFNETCKIFYEKCLKNKKLTLKGFLFFCLFCTEGSIPPNFFKTF